MRIGLHPPPGEMAGPRAMAEKRIVKDVVMGAVKPDGAVTWINVSAAPLLDATGELEGVVGTFTDITTSKRAEDALREAEERHRGLFEESPIAIELYDAAGGLGSPEVLVQALRSVPGLEGLQ